MVTSKRESIRHTCLNKRINPVARQMSAAAAVQRTAGRVPRYAPLPIRIQKPLKRNEETGLPIPHVNVILRDTAPSRAADHYYHTLRDDLMYMNYVHEPNARKPPRVIRPLYDPEDPYTKNRFNPPAGGSRWSREVPPPTTSENVVKLERIQLHSMQKSAISSRSNLLGAIMAFRAISGESYKAGGRRTMEGVQIVKGKKSIGNWLREGVPVGVKVDLKGPQMYEFLGTLVDFVLPRLKEYPGVIMPSAKSPLNTPHGASGVVSFGLPPEAMVFFPQIEVNVDAYPARYGMHIHFITNAEGVGAQNAARALLSGFQIPFARRQ